MARATLGRHPGQQSSDFARDILVLLLTIYIVASSFNSLLWDTTEAHWFLLLSGCLYVAARRRQSSVPEQAG